MNAHIAASSVPPSPRPLGGSDPAAQEPAALEPRVGLFLNSEQKAAVLRPLLEAGGITVGLTEPTKGKDNFLQKIVPAELELHGAIVLDIAGHDTPLDLLQEVRERCPGHTLIVAVGKENDLGFYRRAIAAGACDYFAEPLPEEQLVQALRRMLKLDAAQNTRVGSMIAVYGTHGGVGAGVTAGGLATVLAQHFGRSTVLLDSDFFSPSAGLAVGSDMPGNLGILLDEGERLDKVLVEQAIQKPHGNLALLDGYEPFGETRAVPPENVERLVDMLGHLYRYQVWRVAGGAGSLAGSVLAQADVVMPVLSGTLASARAAQSLLRHLTESNPSARVLPVYNNPSPSAPVPQAMMEELIARKIAYVVPYQKRLGEDMLKNVSAGSPAHCLHKIFMRMGQDRLGLSMAQARPWWKRILR